MDDIYKLYTDGHDKFERILQFETIIVIVVVILALTFYFPNTYAFVIILLVFVLFLANIYIKARQTTSINFNKETVIKLKEIQLEIAKISQQRNEKFGYQFQTMSGFKGNMSISSINNLFYDSTLIHFLHSLLSLTKYNTIEYYKIVKGVDSILLLLREMEEYYEANDAFPENTSEMFEYAIQLKSNVMNNLHDFIYSLPVSTSKYHSRLMYRFNVLLMKILDTIHGHYLSNIKIRGMNTNTKFVNYNRTKHYDFENNHNILPGKCNKIHRKINFFE
jgi:hypothetical protein